MTTAAPLSLPLHFASSSRSGGLANPSLAPPDWRRRWRRTEYPDHLPSNRPKTHNESSRDDSSECVEEELNLGAEDEAGGWVTCICAWDDSSSSEDYVAESRIDADATGQNTAPRISVEDEDGKEFQQEFEPDSGSDRVKRKSKKKVVGGRKGLHVLLGTQDGTLWLFGEDEQMNPLSNRGEPHHRASSTLHSSDSPMRSSSRLSLSSMRSNQPAVWSPSSPSTAHQSSTLMSPKSPTHVPSGHDGAGTSMSLTSAKAEMIEPSSSSSEDDNSTTERSDHRYRMDAEEKLEAQWHSSTRDSSTGGRMVGGMMEALGMHSHPMPNGHQNQSPHSLSHGSGSPNRRKRESSASTSMQNSRRGSNASNVKGALADAGLMGALGIAGGKRNQGGSAIDVEEHKRWSVDTVMNDKERSDVMKASSPGRPPQGFRAKRTERTFGPCEPIISIQSPSSSAVVGIELTLRKRGASSALILQQDGLFTSWSMVEGCQQHSLDLGLFSSYPPEVPKGAMASTSSSPLPGPLASLAALRSSANSPTPRSRRNSGAEKPKYGTSLDARIAARFTQLRKIFSKQDVTKDRMLHLLAYDEARRRAVFLQTSTTSSTVVAKYDLLEDATGAPTARMSEEEEDVVEVYYLTLAGHLMVHNLSLQSAKIAEAQMSAQSKSNSLTGASAFFRREGIATPISGSAAPSVLDDAEKSATSIDLGQVNLRGPLIDLHWIAEGHGREDDLPSEAEDGLLVRSAEEMRVVRRVADSIVELGPVIESSGTASVDVRGSLVCIQGEGQLRAFEFSDGQDGKGTRLLEKSSEAVEARYRMACHVWDAFPSQLVSCEQDKSDVFTIATDGLSLWNSEGLHVSTEAEKAQEPYITASLPMSMEKVAVCLSSGHLAMATLADLAAGKVPAPPCGPAVCLKNCLKHVTLLQSVTNPRTQSKHFVAGTGEGDVIFWNATTLQLQSENCILTSPVVSLIPLGQGDNSTLRLHGCLAAVGADGTIAMFLLDGLKHLYIIPGRGAPLERVAVRADELLVLYDDERARVWAMNSLELRRSIGLDQAIALLDDGKGWWSQYIVGGSHLLRERSAATGVLSAVPSSRYPITASVVADVRRAIEAASRMATPLNSGGTMRGLNAVAAEDATADPLATLGRKSTPKASVRLSTSSSSAKKALSTLRPLLRALLPLGLDEENDQKWSRLLALFAGGAVDADGDEHGAFKIGSNCASGTYSSPGFHACAASADVRLAFSLCSSATTARLLSLSSMLLVLANIEELKEDCMDAVGMIGSLPSLVGESYQAPSLSILASYMMDAVPEIQQASRTLFTITLEATAHEDIDEVCEEWLPFLPSRQPPIPDERAPIALSLLGLVATDRYTMFSPAHLKDIASSISAYIADEHRPMHQAIAIDLCTRGFTIWQHYLDAMEVVRTLFNLATASSPGSGNDLMNSTSSSSLQPSSTTASTENRSLARQATLQIAQDNTPLFMTTLSLDILHARSPNHCSATMRLVAFMVRRKPLVLYPNLPRLAEAVVKSLDPTVSAMRETVVQAATVMISELVRTYPTISFHKKMQRLAVGTHEGAVIMYDLKTATRLYVIEGHRASLSAVDFSPDGRRLVTLSVDEGRALIWKVGTGLTTFFQPGTLPKQGAEGGAQGTGAYKAIDFHIDRQAIQPDDLDVIQLEWPSDRGVRIKVGETNIAFDVA